MSQNGEDSLTSPLLKVFNTSQQMMSNGNQILATDENESVYLGNNDGNNL